MDIHWYWRMRNYIRDNFFNPIWFRFFGYKHHIVKTKLTPSPWYDTDTRMLYAVMSLVEDYVHKEMQIWSAEERADEMNRIKSRDDHMWELDLISKQFMAQDEILSIYTWWKNYKNKQNEIDESLNKWSEYMKSIGRDGLDFIFDNSKMTDEQEKEERRLSKIHIDLEIKLKEEEQYMLKKVVEFRGYMWT